MNNLKKKEFVEEVAERSDVSSYTVEKLFSITANMIIEKLADKQTIEIPCLGKFMLKDKNCKNLFGQVSGDTMKCFYPAFTISDNIKKGIKKELDYKNRKKS